MGRRVFTRTSMAEARSDELAWFGEVQRHTALPVNAARFEIGFSLFPELRGNQANCG